MMLSVELKVDLLFLGKIQCCLNEQKALKVNHSANIVRWERHPMFEYRGTIKMPLAKLRNRKSQEIVVQIEDGTTQTDFDYRMFWWYSSWFSSMIHHQSHCIKYSLPEFRMLETEVVLFDENMSDCQDKLDCLYFTLLRQHDIIQLIAEFLFKW